MIVMIILIMLLYWLDGEMELAGKLKILGVVVGELMALLGLSRAITVASVIGLLLPGFDRFISSKGQYRT